MATKDADEKAPEIEGDESGVKEGSGKGPEADSNKDKGSKDKELEKKYSEADVEAIFNRKFGQKMYALEKKYGMTLDELKAKADELDKLKEGSKSELEKLTGNLARAEKKIAELEAAKSKAELDIQKVNVLLGNDERFKKIPLVLKRITGTTEDEIKADIEELKTLGLFEQPKGDGTAGNGSGKDPFADMRNKAAQGSGKTPPAAGKEPKTFSRSQIKGMSKEEYKANREEIMAATAANLITND
jgi:hypothetical protein